MTLVASLLSGVLLLIAAVHVLWAVGFWWPIRDEERLVAAVVGTRNATRMPGPIPCALVAVALITAAWWPWFAPGWLRQGGLVLLATVFLIRGILPWRAGWRRMTSQEPFRTLDSRYYGPLCLALGLGFAGLALVGD
jgi:hypothetical protein